MSIVAPAILASSREDFDKKLATIARIRSVSRIQIDVVDGKFAAPASWPFNAKAYKGEPTVLDTMVQSAEMLPCLDRIEYEVDLMCFNPEQSAKAWVELGVSRLTFHAESMTDIAYALHSARTFFGKGDIFCGGLVSFGLALNIDSDLSLIEPHLTGIEYVQFMGIARIGRQGQPFDRRVLDTIHIFHARHPSVAIQVDGGVSLTNAKSLLSHGVSSLVIGSAVCRASDPDAEIKKFEAFESHFGV